MTNNVYGFSVRKINGADATLGDYKNKVLLLVNVASQCGLTPQYDALEKVYEQFHERGFEILGFPANEFGAQEPGTNAEIQEFCRVNYGVKFTMFEKIVVTGDGQHPLYQFLTEAKPEAQLPAGSNFEEKLKNYGVTRAKKKDILWNFEKFLVNRHGEVIARFSPDTKPDDPMITHAIQKALG